MRISPAETPYHHHTRSGPDVPEHPPFPAANLHREHYVNAYTATPTAVWSSIFRLPGQCKEEQEIPKRRYWLHQIVAVEYRNELAKNLPYGSKSCWKSPAPLPLSLNLILDEPSSD